MLSNISKMAISMQPVWCMLLFLVLVVNSAWFRVLLSCTLLLKLPVLMHPCHAYHTLCPWSLSSSLHPLIDLGMSVMNWIESCDWQYNAHSGSSHDNESSYSLSESCDYVLSPLVLPHNGQTSSSVSSSVSTWDSLSVGTKAHGYQRKTRKNCWNLGDI